MIRLPCEPRAPLHFLTQLGRVQKNKSIARYNNEMFYFKGLLEENKRLRTEIENAESVLSQLQSLAETRESSLRLHQSEVRKAWGVSLARSNIIPMKLW